MSTRPPSITEDDVAGIIAAIESHWPGRVDAWNDLDRHLLWMELRAIRATGQEVLAAVSAAVAAGDSRGPRGPRLVELVAERRGARTEWREARHVRKRPPNAPCPSCKAAADPIVRTDGNVRYCTNCRHGWIIDPNATEETHRDRHTQEDLGI